MVWKNYYVDVFVRPNIDWKIDLQAIIEKFVLKHNSCPYYIARIISGSVGIPLCEGGGWVWWDCGSHNTGDPPENLWTDPPPLRTIHTGRQREYTLYIKLSGISIWMLYANLFTKVCYIYDFALSLFILILNYISIIAYDKAYLD